MGLFISCKKASELIAKRDMGEINRGERFNLSLHTTLCKVCRLYQKQSQRLHQLMQKAAQSTQQAHHSKELKTRILSKIDKEEA